MGSLLQQSVLCFFVVSAMIVFCDTVSNSSEAKVRKKRVVWIKNRRLILPKGSLLVITPRFQIPFLRQPPEGINSDIEMSWPFYMYFDKLRMTDDSHPWPPFFPFSDFFATNPVVPASKKQGVNFRRPRDILALPPPEKMPGGERAIIMPQLEKLLQSFGLPGRPCLLRAVCEIHEFPLHEEGFGLFGEFLTLIFSISKSRYSFSHLPEYLKAEEAGLAGDCRPYFKSCKKSMFVTEPSMYSEEMQNVKHGSFADSRENAVEDMY